MSGVPNGQISCAGCLEDQHFADRVRRGGVRCGAGAALRVLRIAALNADWLACLSATLAGQQQQSSGVSQATVTNSIVLELRNAPQKQQDARVLGLVARTAALCANSLAAVHWVQCTDVSQFCPARSDLGREFCMWFVGNVRNSGTGGSTR